MQHIRTVAGVFILRKSLFMSIWLKDIRIYKNYIKFAFFEENHGFISDNRQIYKRTVEFFSEEKIR